MSARRAAVVLLALAGSVACGAPPSYVQAGSPGPEGATSLDEAPLSEQLAFAPNGTSAALEIPAFEGESLAVWARAGADVCFSIASIEDGAGALGPETAPARGAALFSLTPLGDFTPSRGVAVRFRLLDCRTSTPARPAGDVSLEVGWDTRARAPERGTLSLRFVISRRSMLFGRPDQRRQLLLHLASELDQAGLDVTSDEAHVVELGDGVPEEVAAWSLQTGELAAIRALAPPPPRATLDVIVVGCLRYDDPFFGPPVEVHGLTPRVTGGGGAPADAIYLPGRRCDAIDPAPEQWRLDRYAHVLAHEVGHFLGLDHTIEADGRTDALDDTGAENVMHFRPGLAIAHGWSPTQARRMRAHPWVATN